MRNVGRAIRVDHFFKIAVICSYQGDIISCNGSFHDLSKTLVHQGRAIELGFAIRCVADHIPVGKIRHDQIESSVDSRDNLFSDLGQAQLGYLVKRDCLWRWNADIIFTFERMIIPTIKEEGVDIGFAFGKFTISRAR